MQSHLIRRTRVEVAIAFAAALGILTGGFLITRRWEEVAGERLAAEARLRGDAEAMRASRERTSRKYWAYRVTRNEVALAEARAADEEFRMFSRRLASGDAELTAAFGRIETLQREHVQLFERLVDASVDGSESNVLANRLFTVLEELDLLCAKVAATHRARVERARAEMIAASQNAVLVFGLATLLGIAAAAALGASLVRQLRAAAAQQQRDARNERLVALGTLSAGIAHEVKNPLAYVTSNLGFIEEFIGRDQLSTAERRELIDAIRDAHDGAARIQAIIDDMRRFARGDAPRGCAADVRDAVQWAVRVARRPLEEKARLEVIQEEVPQVRGDSGRIGQVILNLLLNAAEALPTGARERHCVSVVTRSAGGEGVEVEVKDTGEGMPPEVMQRLFEPFFTTKGPGRGTGLGLAISKAYIHDVGGEISVESSVGAGTTFRLRLRAAA